MTNIPQTSHLYECSPSKQQRIDAKNMAKRMLFSGKNGLVMIAAVLLPPIMLLAVVQVYSMLDLAAAGEELHPLIAFLSSVLLYPVIALIVPMFGGTVYIAAGLARGEARQVKDLFFPYASLRAYVRTWIAFLLPVLAISAILGVSALAFQMWDGLSEMALAVDLGEAYSGLFSTVGLLAFLACLVIGLVLSGYVMPFFWLVFLYPQYPLGLLMKKSIRLAHKKLGKWLWLHLSFVGWFLLSAATAGVLLVLFAAPYYLITVSCYLEQQGTTLH